MSQNYPYHIKWSPAERPSEEAPFASAEANEWWNRMNPAGPAAFVHAEGFIMACAEWRPEAFESMLARFIADGGRHDPPRAWLKVMESTARFDPGILAVLEYQLRAGGDSPPSREESNRAVSAFRFLCACNELRDGKYDGHILQWAMKPLFLMQTGEAVKVAARYYPADACRLVVEASEWGLGHGIEEIYRLAVEDLAGPGGELMRRELSAGYMVSGGFKAIGILLNESPMEMGETVRQMVADGAKGRAYTASEYSLSAPAYWEEITRHSAPLLGPLMRELLCGKVVAARAAAAMWLAREDREASGLAEELLASRSIDGRIGGAELYNALPGEEPTRRLRAHHASEPSKQVREAVAKLLEARGETVAAEPKKAAIETGSIMELEAMIAAKPKSIKLPTAKWLDISTLPPLWSAEGQPLSGLALTWIFQRQAREAGAIHEEVEPLLPLLDRTKNAAFAHALLDQWFQSDMKSGDRWALDVAGLVGDGSIISRLEEPIEGWCKLNRGSRAEWAVHAISLLGTPGALAALDSLVQRYRVRRKYVSEAASNAIQTTADLLGISQDELAEQMIPDFGFDGGGVKIFQTPGGKLQANLQPDFKVTLSLPEDEDGGSLESRCLEPGQQDELKDVTKTLKAAATRQTRRLEDAMIAGRRWPVDTWRRRFEIHPLFRNLAARTIWGTYDESGALLRTFRFYPNGLTAGHDGVLEEFPPSVASVGLVHRLELDAESAAAWSAHLRRFKVKPLFKQADRPVHRLEPLHGNRTELRLTDEVETTAGKLRTELMGRGWSPGKTGDGGWISGWFRKFPACGIDVYLGVSDFHAASLKDDKVMLGSAFFAEGAQGKHAGRDRMDEAERIAFSEVPPIVYSEIVADLTPLAKP